MLLSYMHRTGQEQVPELCLLADKCDEYSVPVSVDCLPVTSCSVVRLGPHEAVTVAEGEAGEQVLTPVKPSKMYLTPSQLDSPGVTVAKVKIVKEAQDQYKVFFQQDKDVATGEWRPWNPNQSQR